MRKLLFTIPPDENAVPRVRLRPPHRPPPWPWRATMFTAVNCYLLWSFTWLQFVIIFSIYSFKGRNLWFYTVDYEPFGSTIPESLLAFAIALSFFAISAVIGFTHRTPRLWKRLLAVILFATFAIGFALLTLHLRHDCYGENLTYQFIIEERYQRELDSFPGYPEGEEPPSSQYDRKWGEDLDSSIQQYRLKYPDAFPHP